MLMLINVYAPVLCRAGVHGWLSWLAGGLKPANKDAMASRIDQAWGSQLEGELHYVGRYFVRIIAPYCVVPSLCTDMGGAASTCM